MEISKEIPTIGLQFSVHESTDAARNELIPFVEKLSLAEIAAVGECWYYNTGRRPFFNYCAANHNSGEEDAEKVSRIFNPNVWEATVSVVCERNEGLPARNPHQQNLAAQFSERLLGRGYNVRVFDPAGQDDIGGGCGQLWFVQSWMKNNPELARPSCGNGLPKVHVPEPSNAA
jgi:23S rRNA (adenine2503-C2)-methyltransferase